MGKGGAAKIEVTRYYLGQHFGICAGADAILRVLVKEKLAWEGEETAQTAFVIDKDHLFGGREKEGGVEAVVYWLPGGPTQVLDDHLAQRLGKSTGADVPGFRGIASAFFVGAKGTGFPNFAGSTKPQYGAYWSANNPYLPGVWIKVRRAPVGLNPDYALIPAQLGGLPLIEGQEVELTWWQLCLFHPTTQPLIDEGRMGISFHDADGVQIGSTEWSIYEDMTVWTERTLTTTAPTGACIVRIYQDRLRNWGVNIDAYMDDITLTIGGSTAPVINPGAEDGISGWFDESGDLDSRLDTAGAHSGNRYFLGHGANHQVAFQEIIPAITGDDANPAHIIFECLTNVDWGMGSPEAAFDKASFEAAAITLYGEAFGLSMIWTRQASIQDFIQEVLDHINAVLFLDPSTGLLTLKLIRGDYALDALAELTPDNADLSGFSRKLWGEISNEIIVTWTNPENEQEETAPPAHDLGSIAVQGLVSDSRNYYGVRNATLATRLAWRELRSSGAPLATIEAEVDRTLWDARPADCVKVTWPEYGLDQVVFRVTSVDYGRVGDMTIKLSLIEDVFGLDAGDYTAPPGTIWENPSTPPAALTIERLFTMPLFFAAQSAVADFVDTPEYPEVVAGVLGTTTQADAYGYDLWDEVPLATGGTAWQQLRTNSLAGHAELNGALAAEISSTGVSFDNLIGDTAPTVGGFVLIGDGGEDENEIAMVDAESGTYTLTRGVLDTVPRAWPAGTPVWFLDEESIFEYPSVMSAGETLDVKLLTKTSQGTLALGDAALVSHELTERPWLPNRPANVEVDGVKFNTAETPVDMSDRADPWVTISFVHRNRLTEDSQVLAWDDAGVTPETGQTATVEVYAEDGTTLLATHDGITASSFDVPDASFGSESIVLLEVPAKRSDDDGDFVSLQAHGIWVQVGEIRITEDGELRITEDGEARALED